MKAFVALAVFQAAILMASADSSLEASARDRSGRILASYSLQTVQNTGRALLKLDNVTQALGNVASGVSDLTASLNVSDTQILSELDGIDASLKKGSDIVNRLDKVGSTLDKIVIALTDENDANTLPGQLVLLYNLLADKFTELEKILGYDNYPPAPSGSL